MRRNKRSDSRSGERNDRSRSGKRNNRSRSGERRRDRSCSKGVWVVRGGARGMDIEGATEAADMAGSAPHMGMS